MGYSFTKLFSSITESTIWVENHATRLVWITMLAMSDRNGLVLASIPGLANRARVTVEEAEAAINLFQSPDTYSRTKEYEGRRIAPIDGGWVLLNHAKYRTIQNEETVLESKRDWWNRVGKLERARKARDCYRQAEADTDTDNSTALSGKPDDAALILEFLNEKADRAYRPTEVNIKFIKARLKEGYTPAQCRQVIAKKVREWGGDDKMNAYLRPATLFNREKFNQYAGELVIPKESNELPRV